MTLSFTLVVVAGGAASGTIGISATSASLTLGGAVTSTIGAITGTYSLSSKTFSLTLNTVAINFSSFVNVNMASAALTFGAGTTTTATVVNGSSSTTQTVSVMTLGINNANIFAGINGPATNSGAVGISITGANLALALMSTSTGTTYYGLDATANAVTDVGLPSPVSITSTNLQVLVNGSNSGNSAVNFVTTFGSTGLSVATGGTPINLNYTTQFLQVSGTFQISYTGFIYISGTIAIQTQAAASVTLTNGTTNQSPQTMSELTIGGTGLTVFAGINGPATNSNAVGVQLAGVTFGMALFTSSSGKVYYGVESTGGTLTDVGLPTGFSIGASNISVYVNGSNDGNNVVNFDSFAPNTGLTVPTGASTTINIDFKQQFLEVTASFSLIFNGFVDITGTMAIQSQAAASVTLTNGTTTQAAQTMSELTIGGTGITIFAGINGPATNSNAVGFQITNAAFALAMFTSSTNKTYYGLDATAASLSGVGLPSGFTATATAVTVEVNGSNDGSNVVDFDAFNPHTGLAVATGGTPIDLDYTQAFLEVSGTITLDFSGFLYLTGTIVIQSSPSASVTLTNGTTPQSPQSMSELLVGGSGITIFAGMNGTPTGAGPNSVGFSITNASFALALFTSSTNKTYYGLEATAASLGPVGLPSAFQASATTVTVKVNSSNDGSNVVDFDAFSPGTGLAVPTGGTPIDLDYTQAFLEVSGTITLGFSSFVYVTGTIDVQSTPSTSVTLTNGTTTQAAQTMSELTVGGTGITIFAGMNGTPTGAGPNSVGFSITQASFALALFTSSTNKVYYGLDATAASLGAVGLPAAFQASATAVTVEINSSNDGSNVVDFDAFNPGTGLAVATGGTPINLDYAQAFLEVSGTITLDFDNFVYVTGTLTVESQTATNVTLTNGTTTQAPQSMSELTVAATGVTIFAGLHGTPTGAGPDSVGFSITNANIALALFTSSTNKVYYGLDATADALGGVGLPAAFQASATAVTVEINSSNDGSNVVDFDVFKPGTGLTIAGSTVPLDFTTADLIVSGTITLDLGNFVYISGTMG
ncbi:MAG TPA: hypothetical protein VGN23_16385, partial [Verrucomicrobiae bacterium]